MLFSESRCFFKRQRPIPPTLEVSAIVSRPIIDDKALDHITSPPSYERLHKRTLSNELTQPAKVYTAKPLVSPVMAFPDPQPTWNHQWMVSAKRTDTSRSSISFKDSSPRSKSRPSFWMRRQKSDKGSMFRNAGLDDQGWLKSEYVEVGDTIDWGVPDEWLPTERRLRYRQ